MKKNKTDNSILFIDASNEFVRSDTKNKLTDKNIMNITDIIKDRTDKEYKSILISNEEVLENDCNIAVNTYLKSKSNEEKIDIKELNSRAIEIVKKKKMS